MFQLVLPEGGGGAGTAVSPSCAGVRTETYARSSCSGHLFTRTAMSMAAIRWSGSAAAAESAAAEAASVDSGAASQPVSVTGPAGAAGADDRSVQPRFTTIAPP